MLLSLKWPAYNKRPVPSPHLLYVYPSKCEKSLLVGKKKKFVWEGFLKLSLKNNEPNWSGEKKMALQIKMYILLDAGRESAKLWF